MGRRRQNSKTSDRPPSPERRSRPNLNPLRRGTSSRDMQTIPSPQESAVSLAPSPPLQVPPLPQPKIPPPTETPRTTREQQRANDQSNGTMDLPSTTGSPSLPATNGLQHPVDPASPQNKLSAAASDKPTVVRLSCVWSLPSRTNLGQSRVDSDGFNIPPAANDEISRVQQEAASLFAMSYLAWKIHQADEPAEMLSRNSSWTSGLNPSARKTAMRNLPSPTWPIPCEP